MVGGTQLPILLYTDDAVLLSPTLEGAQKQLTALNKWCEKWWMAINQAKSQTIRQKLPETPY